MKNKRHLEIIEYLKSHNLATAEDLAVTLNVSQATIRRDLVKLDQSGLIYRVHGGVSLNRFVQQQPSTSEKLTQHHYEKSVIGEYAAGLIKDGDSVVLDAGTTTLEIAKYLTARNVTVITPDLNIGQLLSNHDKAHVVITGGPVDNKSQSCIGKQCLDALTNFCPNKIFLACNSFDLSSGVTAPTYDKSLIKHALTKMNAQVILTADSSKYGLTSLYKICPLKELDLIITDDGLSDDNAQAIEELGVELERIKLKAYAAS